MARATKQSKQCRCIELANKELKKDGLCIDTNICLDFTTGDASLQAHIPLRRLTASRKRMPTFAWTYCAICGKKLI